MMTVGELVRRSGVPATTLRYYDRIGLLVPERLSNNHRRYPSQVLERLRLIQLCQALGCSLDEITAILRPEGGERRRAVAQQKLAEVQRRMAELATVQAVLSHLADCQHTAGEAEECRETMFSAWRKVTGSGEPDT
jgi:DNA-binding transcriptional MerR regulator